MKEQKRPSKIINLLGVIVGIVFLLVAFTPAPTDNHTTPLLLVLVGLAFIVLSLTSNGEININNRYASKLPPPTPF